MTIRFLQNVRVFQECIYAILKCLYAVSFFIFFWKRTRTFFLGLSNINRRMISSKPLSPSLLFVQISVCNFQWYALYLTFFIFMTSLLDLTLIIICVNCALLTYNQSPNTLVILPLQLSWWSLASNTLLPQSVAHIPFSACMLNCFSHVRLFVTPWTMARGSSVHGILQARILEWVVMPSSRGSSWPGIEPASLMSPALAGKFFTTTATWEARMWAMLWEKKRIILKLIQKWPGLPPLYWLLSRAWGQGCSILGGLLPPGRPSRDGPPIRGSEDGTTAPMSLEDGTNPVGLEVKALK